MIVYFVQLMIQETQIDLKTVNPAVESDQTIQNAETAHNGQTEKTKLNLKPIIKLVLDNDESQPSVLLKIYKKD